MGTVFVIASLLLAQPSQNAVFPTAETSGYVSGSGVCAGDLDLDGNDLKNVFDWYHDLPTGPTTPHVTKILPQQLYQTTAAGTENGANLVLGVGYGSRMIVGVTQAGTAGDLLTIDGRGFDGSSFLVILTEGVDFTCAAAASDIECVCNIKAAIEANVTLAANVNAIASDATCSDELLLIAPKQQPTGPMVVFVASSDDTNLDVDSGDDGKLDFISEYSSFVGMQPGLRFTQPYGGSQMEMRMVSNRALYFGGIGLTHGSVLDFSSDAYVQIYDSDGVSDAAFYVSIGYMDASYADEELIVGDLTGHGGGQHTLPISALQTTDATPTVAYTSPTLNQLDAMIMTAEITAIKSDGSQAAGYSISATARRATGGSATLVGTPIVLGNEDDAAWDCTVGIGTNTMTIVATGKAATNIYWRGAVHYQVVRY